jgi:hypothetical protein
MMQKDEVIQLLSQKKIAYIELINTPNQSVLITPELGGRMLGVFLGGTNFLWVNKMLPCDWNCGGHRTWLAPEWQDKSFYLKPDRHTWFVDSRMDPGNYTVIGHVQNAMVKLSSDIDITSVDGTAYSLSITREIALHSPEYVQNTYPFLTDARSLQSISISFKHYLKNRGQRTVQKEIGLWSILQVNPPGLILNPITEFPQKLFYEYYDPFPAERMETFNNGVAIFVDGARRFKIGFPPAHTRGTTGYLSQLSGGRYGLIITSFVHNPAGHYVDKPQGDSRDSGDVIQFYNHYEGGTMAFAELECHAPAETLAPGEEQAFAVEMLFLAGKKQEIIHRAAELLFQSSAVPLLKVCDNFLD